MEPFYKSVTKDLKDPARHPFRNSFLLSLLLVSLEALFFTPYFMTNDDVMQLLILKGVGIGLQPEAHAHLMNVLLSFPLKVLHTWAPQAAWVGPFEILLQWLVLWAFTAALLLKPHGRSKIFLFIAGFTYIHLYFFCQLNFTALSALLFQGGLFLSASLLEGRPSRTVENKVLGLGILCFSLSFLIRPSVFFFSALVALPFAVHIIRKRPPNPRFSKVLCLTILALLVCAGFDRLYYRLDPGWRGFTASNRTLQKYLEFHDLTYDDRTAPLYRSAGWTPNDLEMFKNFYWLDTERYSPKNIERVGRRSSHGTGIEGYSRFFSNFSSSIILRGITLCFLIFLLLVPPRTAGLLLLNAAWVLLLILGLIHFAKAPERVFLPAFVFLANLALYHAAVRGKEAGSPLGRKAFLAPWLLLLIAVPVLRDYRTLNLRFQEQERDFKASIGSLGPQDGRLYVTWGPLFRYESLNACDDLEIFRGFRLFHIGTHQTSPIGRAMLDRFGIKDLLRDMVDDPRLFLICGAGEGILYHTYMREKYGMEIRAEKTFESRCFKVYRVRSKPPKGK